MKLFELAKDGDKEAKDKIVSDNAGLVWSVARRYMGRGYDLEEIFQIGCIGLIKAIDRFDTGYEVMFSTYAVPLIAGEIKRFLRDNGIIKVSRVLKKNGYTVSQARERLAYELGREPTICEISDATELSCEDILLAIEANREIESIYQTVYGHDGKEVFLVDKLESNANGTDTESIYNRILLEQALETLSDSERMLIELRYFQDKTQVEVAKKLGISQVQVSRLEKKLLLQMRKNIGEL